MESALLIEERLGLAVESRQLGMGEFVIVLDKLGSEMMRGVVRGVYMDGSVHVESTGGGGSVGVQRVYASDLYMFVPLEDERIESDPDSRPDMGPDVDIDFEGPVVTEKRGVVLSIDERVKNKMDEKGDGVIKKSGGDDSKGDGGSSDDVRSDTRSPGSKVDVGSLPVGLKKKVVGVDGLDDSAINGVISAISDAAQRSLRDVGVRELDVFKVIVKIQKSVEGVLSSKSE